MKDSSREVHTVHDRLLRPSVPGNAGASTCAKCGITLQNECFEANSQNYCRSCYRDVEAKLLHRSAAPRLAKALLLGILLSFAFAFLWSLVRQLIQRDSAILAAAMGWLVGKSMLLASGWRGGRRYQLMAVFLAYLTLSLSYVPRYYDEYMDLLRNGASEAGTTSADPDQSDDEAPSRNTPAGQSSSSDTSSLQNTGFILLYCLWNGILVPFRRNNLMGYVILFAPLWMAWLMNRAVPLAYGGHERISPGDSEPPESAECD